MKKTIVNSKLWKTLRNKISALKSRMSKREEVNELYAQVEQGKQKWKKTSELIAKNCSSCSKELIKALSGMIKIGAPH